jgi:hypothetical protein
MNLLPVTKYFASMYTIASKQIQAKGGNSISNMNQEQATPP